MMKGVYASVIIAALVLISLVYWTTRPPGTLTFDGIEYELLGDSGGTALYTPDSAPLAVAPSHLKLVRVESGSEGETQERFARQMKGQGASRIDEGRYWKRDDQTATHIVVRFDEGSSMTMLTLTEKVGRMDARLHSPEIFWKLETLMNAIPRRSRWLPSF